MTPSITEAYLYFKGIVKYNAVSGKRLSVWRNAVVSLNRDTALALLPLFPPQNELHMFGSKFSVQSH